MASQIILWLPYFEQKDIRSYNYLTELKQRIFIKEIWKLFKISYRGEIAKFVVMGLDRQDSIMNYPQAGSPEASKEGNLG